MDVNDPDEEQLHQELNNIELGAKVPGNDVPDGGKPDYEEVLTIAMDDEDSSGGTASRILRYGTVGKKTAAQGLMDIALVTANANQLRYILEFNRKSHTFLITLSLIIFSIALQLALAMLLIFKGRYYVKGESKCRNAKLLNTYVLLGVFLITVVNIFIASFTTMDAVP
ncbi:ninjurin-B isoform X2 [Dendroctonus ponderosae]|uniref:ninjurin-B isoform X2 n=1 Tax=Dendroctonus ponderosae TaxID=77166 RepID=UPI002035AF4D|nr:ninjurin-B isoform X2 [Dendroctonus ponderosae]